MRADHRPLTAFGAQTLSDYANCNLLGYGHQTYFWNARDSLTLIKRASGAVVASFSFDALARRQTKAVNGVASGYVYYGLDSCRSGRRLHMWPLILPKPRYFVAPAPYLPLLLLVFYVGTKSTDAYEKAERFVAKEAREGASIGSVTRTEFKFWEKFEFTQCKTNFSIKVQTKKGKFIVDV